MSWPEEHGRETRTAPSVRRWGLRLLAFLLVGFLAVVISSIQGAYSLFSLLLLVIGLVGAAYCTVLGLVALYRVPPDQRARGRTRF